MNYILDYLNSLSGNKYSNLVFSSFHNVQVQDPLSKLIKWLNTEKRTGIRIKSEEDLLIEDFLSTNSNRPIQLNLDEKKDNNKIEISVLKKNRRNPQFPTEQQKLNNFPVFFTSIFIILFFETFFFSKFKSKYCPPAIPK